MHYLLGSVLFVLLHPIVVCQNPVEDWQVYSEDALFLSTLDEFALVNCMA